MNCTSTFILHGDDNSSIDACLFLGDKTEEIALCGSGGSNNYCEI